MKADSRLQREYDRVTDVLYISIGEPRECFTEAVEEYDNILLRYDMNTLEIQGVTILEFSGYTTDELLPWIPIDGVESQLHVQ
jgi:uncharacterized protein YuzE